MLHWYQLMTPFVIPQHIYICISKCNLDSVRARRELESIYFTLPVLHEANC